MSSTRQIPVPTKEKEQPAIQPELEKSSDVEQPETGETTQNGFEVTPNAEETAGETAEQKAEETAKPDSIAKPSTNKIHVVKYVGHSLWTDRTGEQWSSAGGRLTSTGKFTDDEYNGRDDIQFMVKYGEMEHEEYNI